MFLRDIKRLLRGGYHPATHAHLFGGLHNVQRLGTGAFRTGYRIVDANVVVKEASHTAQLYFRVNEYNSKRGVLTGELQPVPNLHAHVRPTVPYKQIRRNGFEVPHQWYVYSRRNGWWQIQKFYKEFNSLEHEDLWNQCRPWERTATWEERVRREQWRTPKNPLPEQPVHLDLHTGNLAINERNKIVAFDW